MSQFNRPHPWSNFDKDFNRMRTFIKVFSGIVFVLMISIWIFGAVLTYKVVDQVNEQGLKGVVEQVWCGKDADCKQPIPSTK